MRKLRGTPLIFNFQSLNELHESASLEIDRRLMLARLPIASLTCPDISNSLNTNRRSKTPNSTNPNDEKFDNRTDFVETSCRETKSSKYSEPKSKRTT